MNAPQNILIIKHGALGDIIMATGAFAAIRAQHTTAHIVLLTTKPFAELLAQSPYFNEIWVDSKPRWRDRKAIGRLRAMLRSKRFAWVYDLQASKRTTLYQWLLPHPWPNISNRSRFASHTRPTYDATRHTLANLQAQLKVAGIVEVGGPDVAWMNEDTTGLFKQIEFSGWHIREWNDFLDAYDTSEARPYALLVPGGAPHRPEKRWPAEQYASLASELVSRKITPVLLGTKAEADVLESIAARVPQAVNLGGKTSIAQLATLGRGAALAVGNDTGPMHVIAASGCPALTLFSAASDPARTAPLGVSASTLREADLRNLSVDRVLVALPQPRISKPSP
ncbi:MAG: glycosyltransferase family 9 protein [Rickettsiales bacterium]